MKRKIFAFALTAALVSALSLPAVSASAADTASSSGTPAIGENQTLPDSVLYYGEISEIIHDEDGSVSSLLLQSEGSGDLIVHISDKTVWIDSGHQQASDPSDLKVGERIYVFHSPAQTMSLPPQSAAFAIVRDIPMDAMCAQYHKIEEVTEREDGKLQITTSNGGLYLIVDENTKFVSYDGKETVGKDDLKPGNFAMFWYGIVATSYPGQAYPNTVMILPGSDDTLTGTEMAALLQTLSGETAQLSVAAEDDEPVTLEGFVTELWKMSGSPKIDSYWKLLRFEDAGKISMDARYAMRWADSNGLLSGIEGDLLRPDADITKKLAGEILTEYKELAD